MRATRYRAGRLLMMGLALAGILTGASVQAQEDHPMAPDFPAKLTWFNTEKPVSLKDLRGKIVLLDFWTYCCINCIHAIPTLKKLEAKYPNELVVIGVHSGKFQAEKDAENIREAVLRYELEHPVVNDKDYAVWNSYRVSSWPTIILIRPDGKVEGAASGEPDFGFFEQYIGKMAAEYATKGLLDKKPIKWALERDKRLKPTLNFPGKVIGDEKSERLFFSDSNNNRVVVTSLTGEVQEVIGDGSVGLRNGTFAKAQFFRPQGLAYDSANDLLYVADTSNHAVRKIDLKAKTVSTVAGTGKQLSYPPRGGVGTKAALASPWDVLLLNGKLFVAMAGCHQLWWLDPKTGEAKPYVGTGREDIVDGPKGEANLAQPSGLTTDGANVFFADSEVSAVRQFDVAKGKVSTLVGQGLFEFGDIDGDYPQSRLQHPLGVAYRDGYVYVADAYNHKIKRVNAKTKQLETFIGTGKRGVTDGDAKTAQLNEPNGLFFVGKKLYIADTNNNQIRVYDTESRKVTTLKLSGIEKLGETKAAKN